MSAKPKILVVEDERDIADLIALHLTREGFAVDIVEDGEAGWSKLNAEKFDLVVLDWMLPGVSGLELCKKIRSDAAAGKFTDLAILMVTARAHSSDIVVGLEMGADDYVTKPFEVPVLLARVRALLRRGGRADESKSFEIGGLKVDSASYRVTCNNEDLQLTPSEFKLLVALLKSHGRVLTRERLIDLVQGEGVNVVDRTIDTHVFGLRKKLGDCAALVETIRGVGYRVRSE